MKSQAVWFCVVGLTSFAAISSGWMHSTAQQLWNPEIAQAAKITRTLLKNKSRLFPRNMRPVSMSAQPAVRFLLVPHSTRSSSSL
ncbi:hypothetical protein [Leptolyngbya sp. Cla-17]|uniref:hypothetical protein n=1 Tax=Leptolyngbya sp. Cla-17 TaxID=2803751 RepID=UPI00149138F7|nr:hypothetical protein [Leptolyngbya sp. Cla-17]